jgi:deoxycytidine triphosphate deaminase
MVIGTEELLKLVRENKLVENLSERELTNPEGAGLEVRVGEIYALSDSTAFLGVIERQTPEIKLIAKYGVQKDYVLEPNEYVLIKTIEKVNLPKEIQGLTMPRSTLQRCGIILISTQMDPGYSGELTFGMKNLGGNKFRLELGARVAKLLFVKVDGSANLYRGQWKGGRVSTDGREKQV